MSDPKPCPFCGSSDVGGAGGQVHCYSCPAVIEVQNTNTPYAVDLWNRRTDNAELSRLQSENEALRAQLTETEEKGRVLMDISRDLKARVTELESTGSTSTACPFCFDQMRNNYILRKQAEAVEAATASHEIKSATDDSMCYSVALRDYAQRLREQADEAERAGGEHG